MSFISQRPQEISKKALNQAECVFAFQMNGPHERKALQYWLNDKGAEEKLEDILPRLEVGAPHVWSPQWLKVSKVVHILPIESLDTSRTPKVGDKKFKRKALRPIDLRGLEKEMAATIERSKAEDPKELRKRIAELEKGLAKKTAAKQVIVVKNKIHEVPARVDWKRIRRRLSDELKRAFRATEEAAINVLVDEEVIHNEDLRKTLAKAKSSSAVSTFQRVVGVPAKPVIVGPKTQAAITEYQKSNGTTNGASPVGGGLRRMMIALAQRPQGLTNRQLGVRAGLSSRSGTFSTYLSRGRSEGWIVDVGEKRSITDAGLLALGHWNPLPEGRDLVEYWLRELKGGASRMLAVLADVQGPLTNEELGEAAGISHRSGTFSTYLSRLRTLELVEGRGELRLSEELSE